MVARTFWREKREIKDLRRDFEILRLNWRRNTSQAPVGLNTRAEVPVVVAGSELRFRISGLIKFFRFGRRSRVRGFCPEMYTPGAREFLPGMNGILKGRILFTHEHSYSCGL